MGQRLSTQGCLTFSQKKSCGITNKKAQNELLKKLSVMSINKPILKKVADIKASKERARVAKNKSREEASDD